MVSTVGSRPNHYQTLGLKPTASREEIERAFAREIGVLRPHALGGVAEVSLAYATLRNPAKRRAYDASLGLAAQPKPQAKAALSLSGKAHAAAARAPFLASPPADPVHQPTAETSPAPAPAPAPEPRAQPGTASFIAAALRDLASPEPRHDIPAAPRLPPERPRQVEPEAKRSADHPSAADSVSHPHDALLEDAEDGAIDWKRMGVGAGVLALAAVLTGAWAGWEAGNDIDQQPPQQAVKLDLPPANARAAAAEMPRPAPTISAAPRQQPRPAAAAEDRFARAQRPTAPQVENAELTDAAQDAPVEAAVEPAAAEIPAAAPIAASLPLPNRVVARTIERIGYACGQVASTTAVEGAEPGVFKVTCTSGSSYQAKPVRGRYRFRRLSGN